MQSIINYQAATQSNYDDIRVSDHTAHDLSVCRVSAFLCYKMLKHLQRQQQTELTDCSIGLLLYSKM